MRTAAIAGWRSVAQTRVPQVADHRTGPLLVSQVASVDEQPHLRTRRRRGEVLPPVSIPWKSPCLRARSRSVHSPSDAGRFGLDPGLGHADGRLPARCLPAAASNLEAFAA